MNQELINFFNSINYEYDSNDFLTTKISKVILNRQEETFYVFIENDFPLKPKTATDIIKCAKNGINGNTKCIVNFIYNTISNDDILEYFKYLLNDLTKERPSLVSLLDTKISIEDNLITILVDSETETSILNEEIPPLKNKLGELGIHDISVVITIDQDMKNKIEEEIIADKNKEVKVTTYEEVNDSNNNFYHRKKVAYSRKGLVSINSITQEENNVHLEAFIFGSEFNEIKTKDNRTLYLITLKISDNTSSILAKSFAKDEEDFKAKSKQLKDGKWYSFKGQVRYDNFANDLVFNLRSYEEIPSPAIIREDNEDEKRVELHAHTMMSQMDGVCDEIKLVKQAIAFNHPGIAITDHDSCQAFTHVFSEVTSYNKNLKKQAQARIDDLKKSLEEIKDSDNQEGIKKLEEFIKEAEEDKKNLKYFKIGYGTELDMCESTLNVCYNSNDELIANNTFVIFDTETTGFNPGLGDSMIEIGGVKIHNGEVIDRFDELINPHHHIDEAITRVTDITDEDVKDAFDEETVVKKFKDWIGNLPLVAHNATFDKNMLDMAYYKYNLGTLTNPIIDTLMLSRVINRDQKKHSLKALGKYYGIDTGEKDDEDANDSEATGVKLSDEIIANIKSIKVDNEEIIKTVETEINTIDITTEQRITKIKKEYFLDTIRKASKTEEINIDVTLDEHSHLIDFNNIIKLHPAENEIVIKYENEFTGENSITVKVYVGQHHGADVDSENTAFIFNKMLKQINGVKTLKDLNNLGLLEELAFKNDPKKLDNIATLCSFKNYIVPINDNNKEYDNPFKKYDIDTYRFKFTWCHENFLQMYENIPGKTYTEHFANIYDSSKHITLIAKNQVGLKNLFKIISFANTNFLDRNARIPRYLINENKEGLLVGSACLNGEIFNIAKTRSDEELIKAMEFYDYIEVQPLENYLHLVYSHDINNIDHLKYCLKKIINCAKKAGKLVVATGDVHNIDEKDLIYREIIVNQNVPGKGRHPLARHLSGKVKTNNNEYNLEKIKKECQSSGTNLTLIDEKVLKYLYILSKIKGLNTSLENLNNIYITDKNEIEENIRNNDDNKKQAILNSLRKFQVLGIVKKDNDTDNYLLTSNYDNNFDYTPGHIPNQYFRTTKEMKDSFSWLNDQNLIKEIVITNPNKILDMIDIIEVVDYPAKPYSPIIENSQEICKNMVYEKAYTMYGNPLPRMIEERIAQEFYGDKILGLVERKMKIDHPNWNESDISANFSHILHETINSGYDAVIKLMKDKIIDENPEIAEDEALKEAKASLGGIIGGGFDVIYLIAQKLVKHSNDEGYLVGSRGSVGSSFVATMMGITECNGLPAHYYCDECSYAIFNDEQGTPLVENYSSGFDLPDKICPKCGKKLIREGNDMPFATFLGFNADKVPDIDLNFSGDNQPSAHEYTKVLFGTDNVYRAGTVSTVADKTAFGYVQGFFEEKLHDQLRLEAKTYNLAIPSKDELKKKGLIKSTIRTPEAERLAVGCTGVKRTTGQHPGGIVVVPGYKDVWDFTAFQYPADDPLSTWRTTHFDYHAIEADLLKLDILGHDNPTIFKMLQDLSGIDVNKIDLGDRDTMKIFSSPEILGLTKERLRGQSKNGIKYCPTGTLGIPEFGTSFLLGMLEETKPTTFAELIKISGLSHGTDVWLGNARDLCTPDSTGNIKVPFKDVIGCRDDIMVNLMAWGMKPIKAFKIMEFVRKGKASKDPATWKSYAEEMKEASIPDWYIDSCQKIKYMFPKAHATAYVTSAFRIAWFKVHHPIYFYATYFSIRCNQFDIESMLQGENVIRDKIDEIESKGNNASNKELEICSTLYLALEMTARGFYFKNIDIEKSDAKNFIITEDKKGLIFPFRALDGLGDNVAEMIIKARQNGSFISKEDLRTRGKINNTSLAKLEKLGCLSNLSDSNQLSLF